MTKRILISILLAILLASCSPIQTLSPSPSASPSPSILPITPTSTETATEALDESPTPKPDLRLHIITTSDWTTVRLVEGVSLIDYKILSSSPEASMATFDQEQFSLSQPIAQAEQGQSVSLTADIYLKMEESQEDLLVEIDRGHLGATTVEISTFPCGAPKIGQTLTWEGITSRGENVRKFSLDVNEVFAPTKNEYVVIAQINFWFYGPGRYGGFENSNGERTTPLIPLLGETYAASDPDVVYQQIEWAIEYGVDAFSIEWTTPRGVGCCGSMEDTLDDVFLKSPNIGKVRWVIFYDFVLRLDQTSGLRKYARELDFDKPEVYDTFVADFKHFAEKYFGHPQYLTIDERPVIYVWASNAFKGDFEGAMREAREEVARFGYDVFIVGDEVQANRFDPHHASFFDGNTTFTFLIGGLDISSWSDVGDAVADVDRTFEYWRENIKDLKVIGREENVNFQPAWAPQYDDRYFAQGTYTYVPAASKEQVTEMAQVARKHAEPAGSEGLQLIWLNTWNNWPETTTVEPTANLGPKYPGGNYQFDMLEVVREVFGVETYACSAP